MGGSSLFLTESELEGMLRCRQGSLHADPTMCLRHRTSDAGWQQGRARRRVAPTQRRLRARCASRYEAPVGLGAH